jgi:NAD(P)-dependent dehydrogenase (short-subunit alcohol dehydrogenase family)
MKNDTEKITDIDGNIYHTVTIGKQVWLMENLRTTKYNDGTDIPYIVGAAGTTDTPAFEKFVPIDQLEGLKKHFAEQMPIGRIGQPSDIGKTAVFLASDDASFMLGAELIVDGGMTYLAK